jgi:hypothetical protein
MARFDSSSSPPKCPARVLSSAHALRQHLADEAVELLVEAAVRLALVPAARFERAAQRADGAGVGRAHGDVAALEYVLADAALELGPSRAAGGGRAR